MHNISALRPETVECRVTAKVIELSVSSQFKILIKGFLNCVQDKAENVDTNDTLRVYSYGLTTLIIWKQRQQKYICSNLEAV